jgi:hypothetical protein
VRRFGSVKKALFSPADRHRRARPVVLVCTADSELTAQLVARVSVAGLVAHAAHGATGCLRVATAVAPDVVLVDASVPNRVIDMLRSHPACRTTDVVRLPAGSLELGLVEYEGEGLAVSTIGGRSDACEVQRAAEVPPTYHLWRASVTPGGQCCACQVTSR